MLVMSAALLTAGVLLRVDLVYRQANAQIGQRSAVLTEQHSEAQRLTRGIVCFDNYPMPAGGHCQLLLIHLASVDVQPQRNTTPQPCLYALGAFLVGKGGQKIVPAGAVWYGYYAAFAVALDL